MIFPDDEWKNISIEAKNLIKRMLCDVDQRPSAEEILKDPWLLRKGVDPLRCTLNINGKNLKNYANSNKMRKAVLTYIASRMSYGDIEKLNKNFQAIDENGDGKLTLNEIKSAVAKNKGIFMENVEEIFKSIDTDNSGCIEYTEFISASLDKSMYLQEEKLREAFNMFDTDKSGSIEVGEIARILGMDKNSKEMVKMLDKYDTNKDGQIDFQEFIQMMKDFA